MVTKLKALKDKKFPEFEIKNCSSARYSDGMK